MKLTDGVILFSRLCYATFITPLVISSSNTENTYIYIYIRKIISGYSQSVKNV